jgi:purine-nucleoside phosphorylase
MNAQHDARAPPVGGSSREHGTVDADPWANALTAADEIRRRTSVDRHDVAVVLGSGWGPAVAELGEHDVSVAMADLPGFPSPTVLGHAPTISSLVVGVHRVLVLQGRAHLYEGHDPPTVVHGVRAAVLAGCRTVVLTNAAGSLRADHGAGQAVLVSDHLNLTGRSPLTGPPPPAELGPRFLDLSDLYSSRLRAVARSVDPALPEGVYAGLPGPHYETPAEIRMLQSLGADLVGMSTVLEAIAAHHLGAEVLCVSLVTNLAAGLASSGLDHAEVVAAGADAAAGLGRLLRSIIERLQ